jgi:hypothetical protein
MQPFRAHSLSIVATLFFSQITLSQSIDSNVVIEQKIQTFTFAQNRGENPVTITEKYSEKYRCNEVRTSVLFSEMYNENETITDIDVKIDDKKAKWITPTCDYYSIENIFYSDARICRLTVPLEKKGMRSEVSLVKTYKDPRYFCTVYFTENYFTENKTVSFTIPKWMKIEIKEYNFDGYAIKKTKTYDQKADADVVTYELKNIPAYKSEAYSPGGSYSQPHLLILCNEAQVNGGKTVFFNSVADLYKWYRQLVVNIGDDKNELLQKANELTAGTTDDIQKIKKIFNWVQHNIRYIAFEDGIAGFKPAKANDVLHKKYGDCKGMANLTRGLLQSLGYDARLCWIGTNHIAYDYSTPSMAVDNHMICALFYKGKKYFLDATETNIGFDEYAERIQGRQVLIENGDSYILERVPSVVPEQNLQLEKVAMTFDGSENLQGTVNISYKGESRSDLLTKIQGTKKDNLQNVLTNYLAEDDNKYEISDLNTGTLLGTDSILNIKYNVKYNGAASAFGKEIYLEADFRKELDGFTIDTAKRKFDVMLPYKMNLVTESMISIPAGYKITQLPANKEWKLSNAHITIAYTKKGDKIEYKKQIRIPDIMLKKKSFSEWNRIMKELSTCYREQIIFEKQ